MKRIILPLLLALISTTIQAQTKTTLKSKPETQAQKMLSEDEIAQTEDTDEVAAESLILENYISAEDLHTKKNTGTNVLRCIV